MDASGVPMWATVVGDTLADAPGDIQLDGFENLYLLGVFATDSINLGNTTLYNSTPGTGTRDFYIAVFDSSGSPIGAFSEGGDDGDFPCFAVNDNSSIYLSGQFSSNSLTFGSTTLNNPNFPNTRIFLTSTSPILSGLNDLGFSENFSIYPNPAGTEINLQIKNGAVAPSTVSILNPLGELVYSKVISNELNSTVDVSMLPAGVYLLQIQNKSGVASGKFIKH